MKNPNQQMNYQNMNDQYQQYQQDQYQQNPQKNMNYNLTTKSTEFQHPTTTLTTTTTISKTCSKMNRWFAWSKNTCYEY